MSNHPICLDFVVVHNQVMFGLLGTMVNRVTKSKHIRMIFFQWVSLHVFGVMCCDPIVLI
jgi:hypothetical protein